MSSAPYALERAVAISAVARASSVTARVFRLLVTKSSAAGATVTKSDASPVTVGDYAAQAVVNIVLGAHFPDDKIVGEEDAAELRKPESAALREQVVQLANEALSGSEQECPAQDSANKWGAEPLSEEKILAAIDRGNHEGGATGRE
jgi:3'(2'), 5'-bisphosphate nucleotidase